jgi:hypothetical protein
MLASDMREQAPYDCSLGSSEVTARSLVRRSFGEDVLVARSSTFL